MDHRLSTIVLWLLACVFGALSARDAMAQPGACTTATSVCEGWVATGPGPQRLRVYRSHALDTANPAIQRALVLVHGPTTPCSLNRKEDSVSSPVDSANLLIKLYELRREPAMREARAWYAYDFNPSSFDEVMATLAGPDSGRFRMVSSYWDMAASFVNHGAIDEQMFNDANGEQVVVFAKLEPFVAEYRERLGSESYFAHLEKLVMKRPGAKELMAATRERFRRIAATRQR
jgi:hypothetical protein